MGSGQSVPKNSPLTCVLKNLKPLSLTELKANSLKQLCTQIWPQYQFDNQDRWPEASTFDFNILQNLTNFLKRNGKWSEVPYAQAFWALRSRPSLCKACSTHEVLLCTLPPKQKGSSSSTNHRPRPCAPLEFDPADEPLPYRLPRQTALSPSSNSPTGPETSPDSPSTRYPISRTPPPPFPPQLPHGHIPNTCSPERGGRTRGPHQSPCAIFIVRYEPDRRKVRIIFLKILPDTEKNS